MNFKRTGALIGLVASSSLILAACSDNAEGEGGTKVEAVACEGTEDIKSSGSSAQNNAMVVFANSYAVSCDGKRLDYNSIGSGSGVKEFVGGQTAFGGSDSPLKEKEVIQAQERCGAPAWHLPAVFGPIAIAYNLEGVEDIALSADTLAKIFSGEITKWNDSAIAAENKGKELPDTDITVIFRSDESGTTDNFQKYLKSAAEGVWDKDAGKSFNGGVGEGAKGNEGVSGAVRDAANTITYTEWSFAKQNNLGIANIITSAGPEPVKLSAETAGKTIDSAKIKGEGNDLIIDTSSFYKPEAKGAYPIILPTYEIVCSKYEDADMGKAVQSFLDVAVSEEVQSKLETQGYIPVPDAFRGKLTDAIDAIGK